MAKALASQAQSFAEKYFVKATFSDGTGRSPSLKKNARAEHFLAVRGTEFTNPNDLFADGISQPRAFLFLNTRFSPVSRYRLQVDAAN